SRYELGVYEVAREIAVPELEPAVRVPDRPEERLHALQRQPGRNRGWQPGRGLIQPTPEPREEVHLRLVEVLANPIDDRALPTDRLPERPQVVGSEVFSKRRVSVAGQLLDPCQEISLVA